MRHQHLIDLGNGALVLALLLHALIFALAPNPQLSKSVTALSDKAIELVSPSEIEKPRKMVVHSSKVVEEEQEPDSKEKRFAGEFDNSVKKETQAPFRGEFRQGTQSPELPSEGEGESLQMRDLLAYGSNPNNLPDDIVTGKQTILNTEKVMYASFINRIADEIYHPWVRAAEAAVKDIYFDRKKLETNLYVTKLQLVLNKEGEVKAIQVLQGSGVPQLDEAPKKAVWEAEPFPNPPSQLFEADGFMRITYEFHFEWKTSGFNIVPFNI